MTFVSLPPSFGRGRWLLLFRSAGLFVLLDQALSSHLSCFLHVSSPRCSTWLRSVVFPVFASLSRCSTWLRSVVFPVCRSVLLRAAPSASCLSLLGLFSPVGCSLLWLSPPLLLRCFAFSSLTVVRCFHWHFIGMLLLVGSWYIWLVESSGGFQVIFLLL